MDLTGIEPVTSSMPWKRAPSCATGPHFGKDCIYSQTCGPLSQTLVESSGWGPASGASRFKDIFRANGN